MKGMKPKHVKVNGYRNAADSKARRLVNLSTK